jgi:hypothetical protein
MSAAIRRALRPPIIWSELVPQRPKRQHLEDDLQRQVCQFLTVALPPDATFFSIPNGGKRHPREAARMSGLGLRPGVPDLCVVFRSRAFFIELKTKNGVQSQAQRAMANKLNYCGADVMLCRSVEDCERSLLEACVPLRASVL